MGELLDCRLLLEETGSLTPGAKATVPVIFLRPDLIKARLQVGSRFTLWEMGTIAEGAVQEFLVRCAFKETAMSLSLPPLLPGRMPLLGHLRAFYRDRIQVLCRGYATCGPMFRLRLGPQSMAVLVGPTYHEFFFEQTDQKLAMDRAYRFLGPMFGESVSVVAGPRAYRE